MKQFIKTVCVGGYYCYCFYKITDFFGQTYFVAEPITHGVTRTADSEETLKVILERDVESLNKFWQKVR